MKYIKKEILLSLLALIFLSACSNKKEEKQEETFKTVNYYDAHKKIRDSRLQECKEINDMTETILIDCENAKTSRTNEDIGVPVQINL